MAQARIVPAGLARHNGGKAYAFYGLGVFRGRLKAVQGRELLRDLGEKSGIPEATDVANVRISVQIGVFQPPTSATSASASAGPQEPGAYSNSAPGS